jgi:hypothetical protein
LRVTTIRSGALAPVVAPQNPAALNRRHPGDRDIP